MGTAFIFFSGQIQGALLLLLSEAFETDLTPEAKEISVEKTNLRYQKIIFVNMELSYSLFFENEIFNLSFQTCKEYAKDHTNFLLFTAGYMTTMNVIFMVFLKTDYKRTLANESQENKEENDL